MSPVVFSTLQLLFWQNVPSHGYQESEWGAFDHPQVQPHFLHAMERSTPVERDESLFFSSSLGYFFFQTTLHHVFLENIP